MTNCNEIESLEKFVISILEEDTSEQEVYGYISRYSEDNPFWSLFLIYDGSDGKKYCGGDYPLNITDIENLVNVFSIFSNQKKKIIVDTKGYFSEI